MLLQELDSKDNVQTRVIEAMEQARKNRKRLVSLRVIGGAPAVSD